MADWVTKFGLKQIWMTARWCAFKIWWTISTRCQPVSPQSNICLHISPVLKSWNIAANISSWEFRRKTRLLDGSLATSKIWKTLFKFRSTRWVRLLWSKFSRTLQTTTWWTKQHSRSRRVQMANCSWLIRIARRLSNSNNFQRGDFLLLVKTCFHTNSRKSYFRNVPRLEVHTKTLVFRSWLTRTKLPQNIESSF